jgi:competence ComEA-like helix-hairpin-helix protein
LPDGEGKATVERVCSKCHGIESVARARNTREGWNRVVDDMVERGAEGTDEDLERIVNYLAKNLGKAPGTINVNKATAAELAAALAISRETASSIVSEREKNGPYKQWLDLKRVPGLDLKQLDDKKDRVEF